MDFIPGGKALKSFKGASTKLGLAKIKNQLAQQATKRAGKAAKRVGAETGRQAAKSSANAVKLSQQLASEAQMAQKGRVILENLRSAPRLAKQYGGKAENWVKKSSNSFSKNGKNFETHWYENTKTSKREEFKTKLIE